MAELMKQEEKAVFSLRELYQQFGYSQFKMSKFESYDLYMQNKDFLVSDGIITFTDMDGTLMALKPDVTLSIVKNFRKDQTPIQKVYYNENVYRIAGASHSYREIMQTGLECLGDVGLYEICEVILLAANSLCAISDRFILDISHMQIVWDVIKKTALPYQKEQAVLEAIRDKNEDALREYPLLQKLIRTNGLMKQVLPLLSEFCTTEASQQAYDHLQIIYQILEQNGLGDRIHLDFSVVNDMNYYNGFVFRGYIEGIPRSVLSGGQYDKLMEKMGKNACGIGFAVYLDQLERLDPHQREFDVDTVLLYSEDDDVFSLSCKASEITAAGVTVLLLKEVPDALRYRRLMRFENGRLEILENNG